MRLIDADALKSEFEWLKSVVNESSKDEIQEYIQRIENAPTVDAVVLPCNVGDTVYTIMYLKRGKPGHICERICTGIHISEKVLKRRSAKAYYYLTTNTEIGRTQHIPFSDIGRSVFFTREEAEAALAKMW